MKKAVKFVFVFILLMIMICLVACSSNDTVGSEVTREKMMQYTLDDYFNSIWNTTIGSNKFRLRAQIKCSFGDCRMDYEFSKPECFEMEYKERFGSTGSTLFLTHLSPSDPYYKVKVVKFPEETEEITCKVSLTYESTTVYKTVGLTFLGGADALLSVFDWHSKEDGTLWHLTSQSDTKSRDGYRDSWYGAIDLSSLIMTYRVRFKVLRYGEDFYTKREHLFEYNAKTGELKITDSTKSNNVKEYTINLHRRYTKDKYEEDKANGWDWSNLDYFLEHLDMFDSLLILNNQHEYLSVFSNKKCHYERESGNYTYKYLFKIE